MQLNIQSYCIVAILAACMLELAMAARSLRLVVFGLRHWVPKLVVCVHRLHSHRINDNREFRRLTETTPRYRLQKNGHSWCRRGDPTYVPNLIQIGQGGLLGKCVKYNKNLFRSFSLTDLQLGQSARPILVIDGSKDMESRREVPFGALLIYDPLRGVNPKNPPTYGRQ